MEWLLAMFLFGIGGLLLSIGAGIGERRVRDLVAQAHRQGRSLDVVMDHVLDDV